jgi:hypothetical protein
MPVRYSWQEDLLRAVELGEEAATIALSSHNEGRSLKLGHRRLAIRHITELDAVLAHGVLQLR